MSDHLKFDIHVVLYDRVHMDYDGRGEELKVDCVAAIKKLLEEKGYREYREEFWVSA